MTPIRFLFNRCVLSSCLPPKQARMVLLTAHTESAITLHLNTDTTNDQRNSIIPNRLHMIGDYVTMKIDSNAHAFITRRLIG